MNLKVLIATRVNDVSSWRTMLGEKDLELVIATSLSDSLLMQDFQVALIEEDFDGAKTGWTLAQNIRNQKGPQVRIVILTSSDNYHDYFRNEDLIKYYDWILNMPASADEIYHEIYRGRS
jgi:two-component SAPR family response regulator